MEEREGNKRSETIIMSSHGRVMFVLATIIMMIGNVNNVYALMSCSFLKDTNLNENLGLLFIEQKIEDGKFHYCPPPWYLFLNNGNTTTTTANDDLFWSDSWLRVARIVGLLSCSIGLSAWITMLISLCCPFCKKQRFLYIVFGMCALLCTILSAVMFLAFFYSGCGKGGCSLGFGSIINIITVVFYFTASLTCFFATSSDSDAMDYTSSTPVLPLKNKEQIDNALDKLRKEKHNYINSLAAHEKKNSSEYIKNSVLQLIASVDQEIKCIESKYEDNKADKFEKAKKKSKTQLETPKKITILVR